MARLKHPLSASDAVHDVTPQLEEGEAPGDVFSLVDQPEWANPIRTFLDEWRRKGEPAVRSWRITVHYDPREVDADGKVLREWRGRDETLQWSTEPVRWVEWKRAYYTALRGWIERVKRRELALAKFRRKWGSA